ncbi:hypothetical protein Taro_035818 [Colocasia esculenta]|uniref:Glutaredoxin domain-containing protein n=1 Tax=Colocasia esculenta TaxID=4460 RepID=A0A843W7T9_COLES|nr:hypothetical protein [Colocasia esculenta]
MGCVSSKLAATHLREEGMPLFPCGGCPNHVVSLTSSTYGALKLDRDDDGGEEENVLPPPTLVFSRFQKKAFKEEPEVINAWELMGDLDDEVPIHSPATTKKTGKPKPLWASPKRNKLSGNAVATPRRKKKIAGKENLCRMEPERQGIDPARVLRPFSPSENAQRAAVGTPSGRAKPATPTNPKTQVAGRDPGSGLFLGQRRCFSPAPLFDPELVAALEREHCEEGEQIKKMVSAAAARSHNPGDAAAALLLESYARKCPPGGELAAVLYTTTLRGIRKTYEECNAVRSAMESHDVQVVERDISMDAGYREELRLLMERREVRVPVLFVKGRLVGGAEEVQRLEEEGRLGLLLTGIPRAAAWCEGCGGVRFVLCMDCSGSCKVLDEEENRMVRCAECNENGLIRCPICC